MSQAIAARLAPLIGLDEQTTNEQILPHLSTMSSPLQVESYLSSLLAPGKASRDFISYYLMTRFNNNPTPPGRSTSPATTTTSTSRTASRPASPFAQPQPRANTKAASSSTASSSRAPTPSAATTSAARGAQASGDVVEFSPEAKARLKLLDRSLKSFDPAARAKSKHVECFCSARQHELSRFVPLCPSCGLVLCSLNSPIAPCPSCSHSPLLPESLASSHVAELSRERQELIDRERVRSEQRRLELEAERRRIKFPELGAPDVGYNVGGGLVGGGYAGHAGGSFGGTLQERIQRSYETGISLNGRNFGHEKILQNSSGGGGGKVLRLDGKGKVKVETKKPKKASATTAKKETVQAVRDDDDESEDDEGLTPWTDPHDDGVRSRTAGTGGDPQKEEGGQDASSTTKATRVFENLTIHNRPMWIEREELSRSIVDDPEAVESVSDTRGSSSEAKGGKKSAIPGAAADQTNGKKSQKKKKT